MTEYKIRPTHEADIPRILELFEHAKAIMRKDGNMTQWAGPYPGENAVRGDIERGVSFVLEDSHGVLQGTFAYIPGVEPTYLDIEGGEWLDDVKPYATIHRLASTPDSHGIADAVFDFAFSNIDNVRIDTHEDNKIMRHCISRAGFSHCGTIYVHDGTPRLAFQKII